MLNYELMGVGLSHIAIVIFISSRVIMKRRAPGVSLAWLILVIVLPYGGAILYLLVGERPLGRSRTRRAEALLSPAQDWLSRIPEVAMKEGAVPGAWTKLRGFVQGSSGISAVAGNRLELIDGAEATLKMIIDDIDRARSTCDLEFYIWNNGGLADEVAEALIRAEVRGVRCRVLLDSVGSGAFLRSALARRMRDNGVDLVEVLPVGLVRGIFVRMDLRMHRKIVVIDGAVAFTGSLNLVDPKFFKQGSGVGEWVDAMVRITGPAAKLLEMVFVWDWLVETGETLESAIPAHGRDIPAPAGNAIAQILPSGPGYWAGTIHQLLLTAIYSARRELILTTPYFVPDEAFIAALQAAAQRGVEVTLIIPYRIDSILVRYASQAYNDDLLRAGVRILRFRGGLLHTKSVVIDGETTLFGTVNLDIRSMRLNFEVTMIVYDAVFGQEVRSLQMGYAEQSEAMDLEQWRKRGRAGRVLENAAQLMSPLL